MNKKIALKIYFFVLFALFFSFPIQGKSAMTGGSYSIPVDSFSVVDQGTLTGGDYTLKGTSGDFGAITIDGGVVELRGGFQAMVDGLLSYSIDKSAVSLGTLSLSSVSSDSVVLTVTADSITGYAISMTEDGNLRSGSLDIDDISSGNVTAGTEGYGIITSGTNGLHNSADTAISGTVSIASSVIPVSQMQTSITFKAAIGYTSRTGSYSHTVTFTLNVNP